jgi:hypothetical protein
LLERAAEQAKKQRELGDNDAVAKIGWFLNDAAHQYEQLAALLEANVMNSPIRKTSMTRSVSEKGGGIGKSNTREHNCAQVRH